VKEKEEKGVKAGGGGLPLEEGTKESQQRGEGSSEKDLRRRFSVRCFNRKTEKKKFPLRKKGGRTKVVGKHKEEEGTGLQIGLNYFLDATGGGKKSRKNHSRKEKLSGRMENEKKEA